MKKIYMKCVALLLFATFPLTLLGELKALPYAFDFEASAFAADWTVIDANNDNKTWSVTTSGGINGSTARYSYSSSNNGNDWMISPAFLLQKGVNYQLTFLQKTYNGSNHESFKVTMGKGVSADAQSTVLADYPNVASSLATKRTITFTPDETGEYNIGFYCYSDKNKWYLYVDDFSLEALLSYPAAITDLSVVTGDKGKLEASLSWTNPDKDNSGSSLDGIKGFSIYRNGELIATQSTGLSLGAASTYTDNTLTVAGKYTYKVVAFNDNGETPKDVVEVTSPWIGVDVPMAPTDVVLSNVEGNLSLMLTPPDKGVNGGWFDVADLKYKLVRTPDNVVVDDYAGSFPFVAHVDALANYSYMVKAVTSGGESAEVVSNKVVAGGAVQVPYSTTFNTQDDADLYTIINANNDNTKWSFSTYNKCMSIYGSTLNDYLVSPSIKLVKGKNYKVTMRSAVYSSANAKKFKILLGKGTSVESLTQELLDKEVSSALAADYDAFFCCSESGEYNIAIYAYSGKGYGDGYVYGISVDEFVVPASPADNLTVTPGDKGALSAALSWVNPSVTTTGSPLSDITKVSLYRNDELVNDFESPALGSTTEYVDNSIPSSGFYTYKVVVNANGKESEAVAADKVWIGTDIPAPVTDVNLDVNDNGALVLSYVAPVSGVNGGFFDADNLTYTIMRYPDEVKVAENYSENTYTDDKSLPLASYSYKVVAVCGNLSSEAVTSNKVVFGDALSLPYSTSFSSTEDFDLWTVVDANGDNKTFTCSEAKSYAAYTSYSTPDDWLISPPFKSVSDAECTLKYKVKTGSGTHAEQYEITIGKTANPADHVLLSDCTAKSALYLDKEEKFKISETGTWYVGIHLKSTDPWGFYVTDVDLSSNVPASAHLTEAINYTFDGTTLSVGDYDSLNVVSVTGSVVASFSNNEVIDLSNLAKGVYVISYNSNSTIKSFKIIK